MTWLDRSSSAGQVYGRTFDGAAWIEITPGSASGLGITQAAPPVNEYDVAAEGERVAVTWSAGIGNVVDVYGRVREGAGWVELGGSATGLGISNSVTESREPDIAWLDGQLFVAYRERIADFEQIYVKTFVEGAWVSAGPDGAVKEGVSGTSRRSLDPKLESGGGELFLAWVDHDNADYADPDARIYVKRWDGTQFVETLPGDASGRGISATGGKLSALDLAVDAKGLPSVGWTDDASGLPQAYLRTVTALPGQVLAASPLVSVQSILDANDLGAGDMIVLAPGVHAGFTLGANDVGVTILGAQDGGSVVNGPVSVRAGGVLQRLNLAAGVTIDAGATGLALVDNTIGGGGVIVNGGADLQLLHNRFDGATGVTIAAPAGGLIAHNDVFASGTGLALGAAFTGDIRDNDIRNAQVGVRYDALAPLNGNRIRANEIGVRTSVGVAADALGFLAGSVPNEIAGNFVGIELANAQVQNQRVSQNLRGVIGSGTLGGADLAHANVIEGNGIGVDRFEGTIQFNRIGAGATGIVAASGNRIQDNHIYRNNQGIRVDGVTDVRIERNTMYTPLGDLVHLTGTASDVEVLHNTLWTEDGYDLFVANDSQAGFFSDFNNLYATGQGKVGFWTRDFTDVLDWQADIARFDLHSVGATRVNPEWALPRFADLHRDDYTLFPMFGTQRFTSPGAAPEVGIPHIALRSPDLYVDAIRGKPLPIRWESFNNAALSPVKIDLYADTPDGPAFVATIVASTPDDGEFLWTPASSGIAFGTYGLRIQVSWTSNPLVLDRSQEPFTVPEDGTGFFVDDASNAGDEYTPNGTGDNRHTGKLSSAPKPYATNLLRVYDLTEGSQLFVDTGTYSMIDPVAVSGGVDLGLGLDQGFLITGPTNAVAVAELFPAIPGDRSRALIELNDADGVEVAHLTLRDAKRGLYAHDDSADVSAHHIVAFGHALDGIRVETEGPTSDFASLDAHNNGAYGIAIQGSIRSLTDSVAYENAAGGMFLEGAVDEVLDNVARDNAGYGFEIRDPGDAVIQGNSSFSNVRGTLVDNAAGGESALVGSKDLAPGTANLIYRNALGGAEVLGNVVFAGNTIANQTGTLAIGLVVRDSAVALSNVVYGNGVGIEASDALVQGNRVYANTTFGIRAADTNLIENVAYSNPTGVRLTGDGVIARNNLIYDSGTAGLLVTGASDVEIVNNTLYEPTGDPLRIEGASAEVQLRNNILWAENGFAVFVAQDSQAGFASDTNVFFRALFGTGNVGFWDGAAHTTFTAWRNATGTDTDSVFANPFFVDENGADNVLGFEAGVSDGRDDDFHERSLTGSFHGGSLAPVEGPSFFGVPGRPVPLIPVLAADGQQSPAIDRGDADDSFANEPAPNGGYVNIGAHGNTTQASLSPAQYVLVIAPNGGEVIEQLSTFDIRWHHAGVGTVDIEYSSTGVAGPFQTLAAGEANDDLYEWTVDPLLFPVGADYVIRVRSSANPAIADHSDATFTIEAPPFQVLSVTPNASGFAVRFNRAIDPVGVNLYDGEAAALGLPDVVLTGPGGAVHGSILLDADRAGFAFVKTGAPLADGDYKLTLESGAAALRDALGEHLDGNTDGVAGGDFATTFTASGGTGARVGIADFARGPEQPADLPGLSRGVPIRIENAGTFTTARFEVHFDPALLQVTGVANPLRGTAKVELSTPGVAAIEVVFAAPVSGTSLELTRVLATVPASAPYGAKHLLDIRNIVIDGGAIAAQDDDGVHVVGFVGDATFSATYALLDVLRTQRVLDGLDSGFGNWPLIDPAIVGDTSGDGVLTASDVTLLQGEISGIDQAEIPPLPAVTPAVPLGGPDPLVSLPQDVAAVAGHDVTVPIELDTAVGLDSVQLRLTFDPAVIELREVRKGSLTADFDWLVDQRTPGLLVVDMARLSALEGGQGSLLELDLRVYPGVAPGSYRLDLEWASLNDGRLTLSPAPKPGADATDGSLQVRAALFAAVRTTGALLAGGPDVKTIAAPSGAAPVIDWSAGVRNPAGVELRAKQGDASRPWAVDFVASLGQSQDQTHPNNRAKVELPLAARLASSLALLPRGCVLRGSDRGLTTPAQ